MAASRGEMPFLDHLEELRSRLLKTLVAVIVGFGAGLWIVQRFQFVSLLKEPIAPYLTDGRLTILSPTEPVMIVLKLSLPHRPGPRLAVPPLPDLGLPLPRTVREGTARLRPAPS